MQLSGLLYWEIRLTALYNSNVKNNFSLFILSSLLPFPEALELCANPRVDNPELVSLAVAAPGAECADLVLISALVQSFCF